MITISDPAVYLQHGFIKIRLDGLSITSRDSIQELVKTFIPDTPLSTDIEVFAAFLEHCVNFKSADAPTILDAFCDRYSIDSDINNIHCIIDKHGLDESGAQLVLRAFYLLWSNPALSHHYNPKSPSSALLSPESTANVMALFGGQHGGSTSCMDEASWLLDVYGPLVSEYAALMSEFLDTESKDPRVSQVYQHGLDVYKWICKPATKPSEDYVRGIAVSLP
ncbi:fatty acid synthase alpha subunit Lsd1, partial [Coemansia sp. RSA 1933]